VLSYFNQPDHEHIERRDEEMQRMLLRLAYSTTSAPEETRKEPSPLTAANEAGSVSSSALSSGADIDAGDLPPTEPNPLVIAGVEIPLFWRNKRIVAVEDERVTEELRSALDAKGVRLFVLPTSPDHKKQVFNDLKSALKE
jgi:hypothetical protein